EVLEDGSNSAPIELDPDTVVVVRVKTHLKPEQLPLEQVSTRIREQLTRERASDAVKARGEALVASLREGQPAAAEYSWQAVEAASRDQEGVEPAVLQAVFRMPKPESAEKPSVAGVTL